MSDKKPGIDPKKQIIKKAVGSRLSEKNQERLNAVSNVVATAKGVGLAGKGTFSFVTFAWPVLLVIVALFLVLVMVISFFQVFGRSENADGCYGIGESSINIETSADYDENADNIGAWLTSTNFDFINGSMSKEQAASIIGNFGHESELNPAIIQGGADGSDKSNQDIIDMGSISGKAVGLAQWDSDRRTKLAEFAEEKGKKWNELDTQLEYLKSEFDSGEGDRLAASGFNSKDKSVEELTVLFNKIFERSSDASGGPGEQSRKDKAADFAGSFKGGSYTAGNGSGTSGGSCLMNAGGSNLDMSNIVDLAVSMSYDVGDEDLVSGGDGNGVNNAKKEYKEAKDKAQEKFPDPMPLLYASCDRFVATVMHLTVDPEIPWGSTTNQLEYLENSDKWEKYTERSEAKPGDIWITQSNGHILIFLGEIEGYDKEMIAHASYQQRVAGLDEADLFMDENFVDTSGRPYYGFRSTVESADSESEDSDK